MALWATLSLSGCMLGPPEIESSSQPIIGGTLNSGDPAVVLIVHDQSLERFLCTGEVVSPHVVLTAAHCVEETAGRFRVFTGPDLSKPAGGTFVMVKEVHGHPDWNSLRVQDGNDVGVVILQTPIDVPPLVMSRKSLESSMVGMPIRLVGYGVTSSTDVNGDTAGVKRQTMSKLAGFNANLLNMRDTAHLTCEGDSGGPALMNFDGQEVIVGITSYGDRNCASDSVDTRVDVYADSFVQPYIDQFDPPPPEPMTPTGPGKVKGGCSYAEGTDFSFSVLLSSSGMCVLWARRRARASRERR